MVDNAQVLIEELALGLAPGARVLLVEPSFDLLSRMAVTEVKELVVINADADPDAPATTTPTGAPLRMRPDWKERPRSKDLIVDSKGQAPKVEVDRILKKAGAYLSLEENAVSRALPETKAIQANLYGILTLNASTTGPLDLSSAPVSPGDSVQISSRIGIEPPSIVAVGNAGRPGGIKTLETQLNEVRQTLDSREKTIGTLEAERAELRTLKAQLQSELDTLKTELSASKTKQDKAAEALTASKTSFTELEEEFETVRNELAEARVAIKRHALVDERLNTTRADLNQEIIRLQERLRQVDARTEDTETVVAERRSLLKSYESTVQKVGQVFNQALPGRNLPAPPIPGVTKAQNQLLEKWLDLALERAEGAQLRDGERTKELRSLKGRLSRVQSRLEGTEALLATEARSQSSTEPTPTPKKGAAEKRLQRENTALKNALKAEKTLRKIAEDTIQDMRKMTEFALEQKRQSATAIDGLTAALRDARLKEIISEEEVIRSASELDERTIRIEELEGILATHHQLQQLMSDAVREAQEAREDADYARRLADENLRIMQAEMERLQGNI